MQRLRIKSVLASLLVFSLFMLHFLPAYAGMKASFLSSQFLAELELSQQRECELVLLLKSVDKLLKKNPNQLLGEKEGKAKRFCLCMLKTLWGVIERANLPWQKNWCQLGRISWMYKSHTGFLKLVTRNQVLGALCKEVLGRVFPVPFHQVYLSYLMASMDNTPPAHPFLLDIKRMAWNYQVCSTWAVCDRPQYSMPTNKTSL